MSGGHSPVARNSVATGDRNIQRGEVLTRDHVLHTALDLIDREGVNALSMRKLGQALHRDPMRLYSHAESKAALLEAVAELVLEALVTPSATDGDWESALRLSAHSFRDIALAHPRMVPLLVIRPTALLPGLPAPGILRWTEGLLVLLDDAGFDDRGALQAYRLFTGFLAGHVLHETQEKLEDSGKPGGTWPMSFDFSAGGHFPRIAALHDTDYRYNGRLELVLGLDIVLDGLRRQLSIITTAQPLTK